MDVQCFITLDGNLSEARKRKLNMIQIFYLTHLVMFGVIDILKIIFTSADFNNFDNLSAFELLLNQNSEAAGNNITEFRWC